jgi:hypothetical protein
MSDLPAMKTRVPASVLHHCTVIVAPTTSAQLPADPADE